LNSSRASQRAKAADLPASPAARPARKERVDARRNRELLIETARDAFAELGAQVSLELIARRAGVGIGTLYRHFPTRNALVEAVCRHEVEQLSAAATQFLATLAPAEALYQWMRLCVDYIATKKVMASVVCSIFGLPDNIYTTSAAQITDNPLFGTQTEIYRSSTAQITSAISLLTERAIAAGEIRADARHMDIIRALAGFTVTYGDDTDGWKASALRLVDIMMDGLRAPVASGEG
jgi:AcrR family transcriptional regulator